MSAHSNGVHVQPRSAFGLAAIAIRTFFRAPIFFVVLSAAQLVPPLVSRWMAFPPSTASTRSAFEFVFAELLFVLVQAPIVERALRLLRGQSRSFRGLLRTTVGRALPMIGLILLQSVIVLLGSIALLLPGVVAFVMLFLAAPICVADRSGPLQSLSQSTDMTRGARWRILGAALLLFLPVILVVAALMFLANPSVLQYSDHVFDVIGAIAGVWLTILSVVVYEDLRAASDASQITDVFG